MKRYFNSSKVSYLLLNKHDLVNFLNTTITTNNNNF